MEDDLNFFENGMEDDLNFFENGRRPQLVFLKLKAASKTKQKNSAT
jgi:hypothetical protein